MRRQISYLFLTMALLISLLYAFSLTVLAVDDLTVSVGEASITLKDTDGDGFYEIANSDELYAFATHVCHVDSSINAELTADIIVNTNVLTNGELNTTAFLAFRNWTPIGNNTKKYTGTFDGNGYSIKGLYFNDDNTNYVGLFGYVSSNGTIRNVSVVDSYLSGNKFVGGVVGYNYRGTIENCSSSCTVGGIDNIGGVVGYNAAGTVTRCCNIGSIVRGNDFIGGVVGYNLKQASAANIINCYNTGSISGNQNIGGVAGWSSSILKNCYSNGIVLGESYVGGVVGKNSNGTITNCYYLINSAKNTSNDVQLGAGVDSSAASSEIDGIQSKTEKMFASGEVSFLLNGSRSAGTESEPLDWFQTLSQDASPVFHGGTVYRLENTDNCGEFVYANAADADIANSHEWRDGVCVNGCGTVCEHETLSCSSSENIISANCKECSTPMGTVRLIDPSENGNLIYNGSPMTVAVENTINSSSLSVTYVKDDETLSGSPMSAGTYTASVSFGGASASLEFTISKASIDSAAVTISAPEASKTPQASVPVDENIGYNAVIEWAPSAEIFGFHTAYTATITLSADDNHEFSDTISVDGFTVTRSNDTTVILTKTFDATRKEKLTSIASPNVSSLAYYSKAEDALQALPQTVDAVTETGANVQLDVDWQTVGTYTSVPEATNTFKWTASVGDYDVNGQAANGTITVTNENAKGVSNGVTDASITYDGSPFDVSEMFTIDQNAGSARYTIAADSAEGSLDGSILTITKAGIFTIKLTTDANGPYAADERTAILTVNKGEGIGSVAISGWLCGQTPNTPIPESTTNGTDAVTYRYIGTSGSSETPPMEAGDYTLIATFGATDLYQACTASAQFSIIDPNAKETRVVYTLDFTSVPESLSSMYSTADEIKSELRDELRKNCGGSYQAEHTVIYDVKLQFAFGNDQWIDATAENFPTEGVIVRFEYPDGTSRETHDFTVTHMVIETSERLGTTAGDIEVFGPDKVRKYDSYFEVTLRSLSPIAIAWTEIEEDDDRSDITTILLMLLLKQRFDITASSSDGGTISPSGITKVSWSHDVTYEIIPDEGWKIASVIVDGVDIGPVEAYTFDKVRKDHTITVMFEKIPWENPYTDIHEGDWFYEDVQFVSENGLMRGTDTEDTEFSPYETVTRDELLTMIWHLEGCPVVNYIMPFTDVDQEARYAEAIRWAAAMKIIRGDGEGRCNPEAPLTREEFAALLYRYEQYKGGGFKGMWMFPLRYEDAADLSDWAYEAICWLTMHDIYVTEDGGKLAPAFETTRAQAAAFLHRFCKDRD